MSETEAPSSAATEDGARIGIEKLQRRQSSPQSRNLHPRFQHLTLPRTTAQRWLWRLPYGRWVRADGREYLFNRWYCPLFERDGPEQPARLADPFAWVHWISQEYFFNNNREVTLRKANAVLRSWKVLTTPVPVPLGRS